MKVWRFVLLFLSAFPILFALTIVIVFFRLQQQVGNGPYYYTDPITAAVYADFDATIGIAFIFAGYSFFGLCGLLPLYLIFQRKQIEWWLVVCCILSYAIGYFAFQSDTMNWILD